MFIHIIPTSYCSQVPFSDQNTYIHTNPNSSTQHLNYSIPIHNNNITTLLYTYSYIDQHINQSLGDCIFAAATAYTLPQTAYML